MTRYSESKYGATKYGSSTQTGVTWILEVDWDGDGIYSGDNEAENMIKLSVKRGRDNMVRTDGKGFEAIKEGKFTATLLNTTGRYNPYDTTSPLYSYLAPGRNFKLRIKDEPTNTYFDIMTGQIDDIRPVNDKIAKVTITGSDKLRFLKNTSPSVALQTNKTIAQVFPLMLTAVDWTDGSSIQADTAVIPFWWNGSESTAFENLKEVADAGLGQIFIASDGEFKYYSLANPEATAATLDGTYIQHEYSLLQPWDTAKNVVDIVVNPIHMVTGSGIFDFQEVWTLADASIEIAAHASLDLYIQPEYNGTPLITTGANSATITFTDAPTGGSAIGVTYTAVAYGFTTLLHITNTSAVTGYLQRFIFQSSGYGLDSVYKVETVDSASITKYGRKEFVLDDRWNQSYTAPLRMHALDTFFAANKVFATVKIMGQSNRQFLDLFDKVGINIPDLYINDVYYVGSIQHDWNLPNGNLVTTTLKLEPIIS